jgi:hypothetical protein
VATPLSPLAFAVLVWGAVAVVAGATVYQALALLAERSDGSVRR